MTFILVLEKSDIDGLLKVKTSQANFRRVPLNVFLNFFPLNFILRFHGLKMTFMFVLEKSDLEVRLKVKTSQANFRHIFRIVILYM